MMNEELEGWQADLPDDEDICSYGGPHEWVEELTTNKIQVLVCSKCDKLSIGWY